MLLLLLLLLLNGAGDDETLVELPLLLVLPAPTDLELEIGSGLEDALDSSLVPCASFFPIGFFPCAISRSSSAEVVSFLSSSMLTT